MNTVEKILEEHQALVERAEKGEAGAELAKDINRFVEKVQAMGAEVEDSKTRNLLRSLLRYWAGQLYELTGTYPRFELQPYASTEGTKKAKAPPEAAPPLSQWLWRFIGGVGLLILLGYLAFGLLGGRPMRPTPPVIVKATATPTPMPSPLPTPTTTPSISIQQTKMGVLIAEAPVKARPDEKSPELLLVGRDLLVEIVGGQGEWLLVRFGDFQGWVQAKYVRKLEKPVFKVVEPGP